MSFSMGECSAKWPRLTDCETTQKKIEVMNNVSDGDLPASESQTCVSFSFTAFFTLTPGETVHSGKYDDVPKRRRRAHNRVAPFLGTVTSFQNRVHASTIFQLFLLFNTTLV